MSDNPFKVGDSAVSKVNWTYATSSKNLEAGKTYVIESVTTDGHCIEVRGVLYHYDYFRSATKTGTDRKVGDLLFDETTEMSESAEGGKKGVKICRYDLIPAEALAELAAAYGVGAKKYGEDNWLHGYGYGKAFGAMGRHIWRFWRGEDFDPETGIHHLALAAWHCFTLMTFQVRGIGTDDRPTKID